VKESPGDPAYGRTNWRRFAVSIGLPLAVAGGLVLALQQGAIAASFMVSGQDFKLSATELDGHGFTQYSGGMPVASNSDTSSDPKASGTKIMALSGIHDATITKLCQTVKATTPFPIVMRIDAGDGTTDDTKVHADDLLIGMSDLQGNATFTNIQIGVNATSLTDDGKPADSHGQVGGFGQQATDVDIKNLKQTASYTSAGKFTLNGMRLHLYVGAAAAGKECFTD
jgi:hypothetical protein